MKVSIAYPADIATPGYEKENLKKVQCMWEQVQLGQPSSNREMSLQQGFAFEATALWFAPTTQRLQPLLCITIFTSQAVG